MQEEYKAIFKEEALELLDELEQSLVEAENNHTDKALIAKIFRALHTIKGSGALFGFTRISEFTHEIENVFDCIRDGLLSINQETINLGLQAKDCIRLMLNKEELDKEEELHIETIITNAKTVLRNSENCTAKEALPIPAKEFPAQENNADHANEPLNDQIKIYRIRFIPTEQLLLGQTDIAALFSKLEELGRLQKIAQLGNVPVLENLTTDRCYIFWDLILTTKHSKNAIHDLFIFMENDAVIEIDEIYNGVDDAEDPDYKKLGFILVEKGDLKTEDMLNVLQSKKRFGEILVEQGLVEPERIESALIEQNEVRKIQQQKHQVEAAASLRVASDKIDQLVNLAGELVTFQARLSQISTRIYDPELNTITEEVERLIWKLRDNTMSIRMLPIGTTFSRFKRLVRDLSMEMGKSVELVTEGGDTEIDKSVIEKLNDPLVHIIRNAIDHGIETSADRIKLSKPETGTITLSAFQSGAFVVIQIKDDGKGLNTEAIREKALKKGLILENQAVSDEDIHKLIFEAGFSTAEKISSISGRGVGMDVVKKNITSLRGRIEIKSVKHQGTTFVLKIPLTLAIIDGLLVKIGIDFFVLPLSAIEECIAISKKELFESENRSYVNVRGEIIPYIKLRDEFSIHSEYPPFQQVVIANFANMKIGFVVDEVIGGHQTVIKSLGAIYKNIEGISGATILGDGTIALIIDVIRMINDIDRLHGNHT
jgi:two-component system chemotaxis sensor kinase CheA